MRLITIILSLGALVAASTDDPPQQKGADVAKRDGVGEGALESARAQPVPDFAKTISVMEGEMKELLSADVGRFLVEEPIGSPIHLEGVPALPGLEPISKSRIELPLKRAILPMALPAPDQPVSAGLVAWHADLPTAQAAARESGKPVLLFQLLGRLDETFC